jgi:hypothetical protein
MMSRLISENDHRGARRDLVPKANAARHNVPDHRESTDSEHFPSQRQVAD